MVFSLEAVLLLALLVFDVVSWGFGLVFSAAAGYYYMKWLNGLMTGQSGADEALLDDIGVRVVGRRGGPHICQIPIEVHFETSMACWEDMTKEIDATIASIEARLAGDEAADPIRKEALRRVLDNVHENQIEHEMQKPDLEKMQARQEKGIRGPFGVIDPGASRRWVQG